MKEEDGHPYRKLLDKGKYTYQEYIDAIEKYLYSKNSLSDFYIRAKEIRKRLTKLKNYGIEYDIESGMYDIRQVIKSFCNDHSGFDKTPNNTDILDKIEEYFYSIDGNMNNLINKTLKMMDILKPYDNNTTYYIKKLK